MSSKVSSYLSMSKSVIIDFCEIVYGRILTHPRHSNQITQLHKSDSWFTFNLFDDPDVFHLDFIQISPLYLWSFSLGRNLFRSFLPFLPLFFFLGWELVQPLVAISFIFVELDLFFISLGIQGPHLINCFSWIPINIRIISKCILHLTLTILLVQILPHIPSTVIWFVCLLFLRIFSIVWLGYMNSLLVCLNFLFVYCIWFLPTEPVSPSFYFSFLSIMNVFMQLFVYQMFRLLGQDWSF